MSYDGYRVKIESGDTYWQTAYDQVKQATPEGQEVDLSKVQEYTEKIQDLTGQKATELQTGTDMILPAELAIDEISADVSEYSGKLTEKQREVSTQVEAVTQANSDVTDALEEYNGITIPDAVTEKDAKTGEEKVTNQSEIDAAKQKQQDALEKYRAACAKLKEEQEKQKTLEGQQTDIQEKLDSLNTELEEARADVEDKKEDLAVKLEDIDSQIEATNGQLEQAEQEVEEQKEQIQAAEQSMEAAQDLGVVDKDGNVISKEDAEKLKIDPNELSDAVDKTSTVEYKENSDGTKTKTTKKADGSETVETLDKDGNVIKTETTEANENTQANVAQNEALADQIQKYLAGEKQMLSQDDISKMDVNGDGVIDVLDATAAQKKASDIKEENSKENNNDTPTAQEIQDYIAGKTKLTIDEANRLDVNGDGKVDILDATELQKTESEQDNSDTSNDSLSEKIQKYISGELSLSADDLAKLDVNGDGEINILDATELQKNANNQSDSKDEKSDNEPWTKDPEITSTTQIDGGRTKVVEYSDGTVKYYHKDPKTGEYPDNPSEVYKKASSDSTNQGSNTSTPDSATPDSAKPSTPDSATPDSATPDSAKPSTPDSATPSTPDSATPDSATPDSAKPSTPDSATPAHTAEVKDKKGNKYTINRYGNLSTADQNELNKYIESGNYTISANGTYLEYKKDNGVTVRFNVTKS